MKNIVQAVLILALAAFVGLSLGKLAQAEAAITSDQPTIHAPAGQTDAQRPS